MSELTERPYFEPCQHTIEQSDRDHLANAYVDNFHGPMARFVRTGQGDSKTIHAPTLEALAVQRTEAAQTIQSLQSQVDRMRVALDDSQSTFAAIRAMTVGDDWAEESTAEHIHHTCGANMLINRLALETEGEK